MSDSAIEVAHLSKVYNRYGSQFWRAMALFGMPVPQARYDKFWALDDVSFSIGRGERVALIGRNGAGKSTLLRHVSGELAPTSGSINVRGQVKALFGLGDGFHPEFSGLQNLKTALALNGFAWRDIPRAIEDVIDFTELEDFIDRPLKEYSAGMYARLAFAVATAARPDILIIDEILGAGDAYFLGKCLQRIRDITDHGSTVLFVSHDMGSALMLCQRGLWIHQGRLRESGDMTMIARSYQAHIREEQELSLRARSMKLSKKAVARGSDKVLMRFIGVEQAVPQHPAYISRMAFGDGDLAFGETSFGTQDSGSAITPIVDAKTNWGKAATVEGRRARPFGNFGGAFLHAPIALAWEGYLSSKAPWVEVDILPSPATTIALDLFDAASGEYQRLKTFDAERSSGWLSCRVPLPTGEAAEPEKELSLTIPSGAVETEKVIKSVNSPTDKTKTVEILDFAFLDEKGEPRHTLMAGRPVGFRFKVHASRPVDEPVAVVAIYRPDGLCVNQMISRRDHDSVQTIEGDVQIEGSVEELLIGPGDYIVSAALFRNLDPSLLPEERAFDLRDRDYALKIIDSDLDFFAVGLVRQRAHWLIRPNPSPRERAWQALDGAATDVSERRSATVP